MFALRMFCLFTIGALLAGCTMIPPISVITSSGRTETQSYDLAGFSKLNVSSAFTVEVTQSERFKVEVTVDDSLLDRLDVRVTGDTLYIGLKSLTTTNLRGSAVMEAVVALPELTGLELSGASRGTLNGFDSGKAFSATVSGASRLSGDITCGDARFDVSGASRLELSGAAKNLRVNASGASTVSLEDFGAADADVEASGASRATVNVRGQLKATASGASTVLYTGDPASVRENTSGASTVRSK